MIDTTKIDARAGEQVHQQLMQLGLETPMRHTIRDANAVLTIRTAVESILESLGLDLSDDSLCGTPKRVAKMFLDETFAGLDYGNFPKATVIENKMKVDQMVLERNITVNSTCEHHLLPIVGFAHVAYIPRDKVLGLSKLNRIVDFFARRPQVQERLTAQVCAALQFLLETQDVAVMIDAEHMCVKTRGVQDACSDTVTTKLGGVFMQASVRAEFISTIALARR